MRASGCFVGLAVALAGLPFVSAREDAPKVTVEVTKSALDFKAGKDVVATYRIEDRQSKPYFYPLHALPGEGITENGPSDHIHHRSAWFCHGDVIPEGLELTDRVKNVAGVDFWSENKNAGKIVCTRVGKPKPGKDRVSVETTNEWRTKGGKKVLDETRTITFVHLGPNRNLIILDIDLHASEYPITFGDTKEGSMGIRIKDALRVDRKKGGKLTNAEGKEGEGAKANAEKEGCWGLVSAWCDYSGPVGDGKTAGLTIFADPKNSIDSAWHARNYGLLAANPFGRAKHAKFPDRAGNNDLVKLKKGEHLKLRYGLYLHAGDVKEGKVAEGYKEFVSLKGK
jgi:hypothetical protein